MVANEEAEKMQWVRLDGLSPWARNARQHSDDSTGKLAAGIRRFGFLVPLTAWRDESRIAAGHGRRLAMLSILREDPAFVPRNAPPGVGPGMVPVMWEDFATEAQFEAFAIADNRQAKNAEDDESALAAILQEMDAQGLGFDGMGFDEDELKEVMTELGDDVAGDGTPATSLAERFGVPPFSVLDTRQGYWQDRRREWFSIINDSGETREATLFRSAPNDPVSKKLQEMKGGVSILDPVLAECVVGWFSAPGDECFDPFAGDSVFGSVAVALGRRFVGTEIRKEQADLNQLRVDEIEQGAGRYINDDARNLANHIEPESVDLVFSCPPYADLEVYSDDPNDLSTLSHADFLPVYKQILHDAAERLRPGRFMVVVMSEVRGKGGGYIGTVPETINALTSAGLALWNEAIIVNSVGTVSMRASRQMQATRKLGRCHQNVMVFLKGPVADMRAHVGDVQVLMPEANDDSKG